MEQNRLGYIEESPQIQTKTNKCQAKLQHHSAHDWSIGMSPVSLLSFIGPVSRHASLMPLPNSRDIDISYPDPRSL